MHIDTDQKTRWTLLAQKLEADIAQHSYRLAAAKAELAATKKMIKEGKNSAIPKPRE